ncbi:MAG TPA: DUF2510 domain-containing protein [Ornithinibacter sp.]|nr:DUF2510 domain-containing protein [Ornithinibacter sp.]
MSAPAGWHLQPDGQERYWDGTAWTDQFRAPLPIDPTAPPPPPSWAPSVDDTQALDVDHTQAIPAPAEPAQPGYYAPAPDQAQQGYAYPQQPGAPQTGYGAPGYPAAGQPYAPPPRQGNALAKGCLIAAIIGVLVLGAAIVGGIYVFNKASDTISQTFPSGLPTDLPTDFPSDLPTEGLGGESIDVTVGGGFELPRATVQPGWVLEPQSGVAMVQISGMKAQLTSDDDFPVLFTMSFPDAGGGTVETVCTAPAGSSGATVDVSCVPLFGDVGDATSAKVTASL